MDNKDFLIMTKGLAVCLVLDTAIGLLNEIAFEVSSEWSYINQVNIIKIGTFLFILL